MHTDGSTPPSCTDPKYKKLSDDRAGSAAITIFKQTAKIAQEHHIDLIYRNNHINNRYDAECADRQVEKLVRGEILPVDKYYGLYVLGLW